MAEALSLPSASRWNSHIGARPTGLRGNFPRYLRRTAFLKKNYPIQLRFIVTEASTRRPRSKKRNEVAMSRSVTDDWERRLEQDGLRKLLSCLPVRRQVPAFAIYAISAVLVLVAATLTLDTTRPGDGQAVGTAFEAGLLRDRGGN